MKRTRFLATILALALLIAPPLSYAPEWRAAAAGETELDDLQSRLDQLQAEETALRDKVDKARQNLTEKKEYKSSLDSQIQNVTDQIDLLAQKADALDAQITEKIAAIAAKEADLADKEKENADHFEKLRQRLRAISKGGNLSVLQMLMSTDSYTDFLIRSKMMSRVADNDKRLMDEIEAEIQDIQAEKQELSREKQTLSDQRAEVETVRARSADKKRELDALSLEVKNVIASMEEDVNVYTDNLEKAREQEEALNKLIDELLNSTPPATVPTVPPTTAPPTTTPPTTPSTTSPTTPGGTTTPGGGTTGPTSPPTTPPTSPPTSPPTTPPTSPGGLYDSGTMYWPVPTVKYLSDTFGGSRNHKGIDIANSPTTPVYGEKIVAAQSGVVIYSNYTNDYGGGYGYYCIVDHGLDARGKRIVTLYAHASVMYARVGQTVIGGQTVLALAGRTGNVTGPHLHFEVREDNVPVDPIANGYLIKK